MSRCGCYVKLRDFGGGDRDSPRYRHAWHGRICNGFKVKILAGEQTNPGSGVSHGILILNPPLMPEPHTPAESPLHPSATLDVICSELVEEPGSSGIPFAANCAVR